MLVAPTIQTKRLHLSQITIDDAPNIFSYTQNPNVLRYTSGTPPKVLAETQTFVQSLVDSSEGQFAWAMRINGRALVNESPVIGVIEFGIHDDVLGSLDYAIAEDYWNQGLMTEAVRAVMDWGFCTFSTMTNVRSAAMTANPASTRVQEKCGMSVVRTEYQTWSKFEEPIELAICRITRDEWKDRSR